MQTTLNQLQADLYGDRDRPIGLVARVKTIEDTLAEQKSNRLLLWGIAAGVIADVLVNLFR